MNSSLRYSYFYLVGAMAFLAACSDTQFFDKSNRSVDNSHMEDAHASQAGLNTDPSHGGEQNPETQNNAEALADKGNVDNDLTDKDLTVKDSQDQSDSQEIDPEQKNHGSPKNMPDEHLPRHAKKGGQDPMKMARPHVVEQINKSSLFKVDLNELWPPNHAMVPVLIQLTSNAEVSACKITEVSSSEANLARGRKDGVEADYLVTGELTVELRSERISKEGRLYLIKVACDTVDGQPYEETLQVKVPHSQGNPF